MKAEFSAPSKQQGISQKRKRTSFSSDPLEMSTATKKQKSSKSNSAASQEILSGAAYRITRAGCRWNPNDWSCAYDTVFMSLYACFLSLTPETSETFVRSSSLLRLLFNSFSDLERLSTIIPPSFEYHRDLFRKALFDLNARAFPISGRVEACLADVVDSVFGDAMVYHIEVKSCSDDCLHCTGTLRVTLPSFIVIERSHCMGLQQYLHAWLADHFPTIRATYPVFHHRDCTVTGAGLQSDCAIIGTPAVDGHTHGECQPLLMFELHPIECWALPDLFLDPPTTSNNCRYQLAAIIYHGNNHFAARLLLPDLTLWKYDGQLNGGAPLLDGSWSTIEPNSLMHWNSMTAHIYLYVHIAFPPTNNQKQQSFHAIELHYLNQFNSSGVGCTTKFGF